MDQTTQQSTIILYYEYSIILSTPEKSCVVLSCSTAVDTAGTVGVAGKVESDDSSSALTLVPCYFVLGIASAVHVSLDGIADIAVVRHPVLASSDLRTAFHVAA